MVMIWVLINYDFVALHSMLECLLMLCAPFFFRFNPKSAQKSVQMIQKFVYKLGYIRNFIWAKVVLKYN